VEIMLADFSRLAEVRRLADKFVSSHDRLDVLVNNAGIMPLGDVLKEPDEVTRRIFEVNTLGAIWGTKAVARAWSSGAAATSSTWPRRWDGSRLPVVRRTPPPSTPSSASPRPPARSWPGPAST
jgi:NAD(P)-dependent dehydrogenase (short-subunit alcohol dehydrogenase family)